MSLSHVNFYLSKTFHSQPPLKYPNCKALPRPTSLWTASNYDWNYFSFFQSYCVQVGFSPPKKEKSNWGGEKPSTCPTPVEKLPNKPSSKPKYILKCAWLCFCSNFIGIDGNQYTHWWTNSNLRGHFSWIRKSFPQGRLLCEYWRLCVIVFFIFIAFDLK